MYQPFRGSARTIARALLLNRISSPDDTQLSGRGYRRVTRRWRKPCTRSPSVAAHQHNANADKILYWKGRVRAGTHAQLMKTSPIYKEIYDSQLGDGLTTKQPAAA